MRGKMIMWRNQYGATIWARTVKELRAKVDGGGCRVSKMYIDARGYTKQVGYVVGSHWFTGFVPLELAP